MSSDAPQRTASGKSIRASSARALHPETAATSSAMSSATTTTTTTTTTTARPMSANLTLATAANPSGRVGSATRPASAKAASRPASAANTANRPPSARAAAAMAAAAAETTMPTGPVCHPSALPERQMTPANILITGASKGLGLGMVRHFLNQTTTVALFAACRDPSSATELNQLKDHTNLHVIQLDVTDEDSIARAVDEVKAVVGDMGLNLLINNAGVATKTGLMDTKASDLINDYATNAIGPFSVTQAFLPLLQRNGAPVPADISCDRAAVVNLGAGLGSFEMVSHSLAWNWLPYRMSKTALHMFTKYTSCELVGMGILMVAIHPGWVQTAMGGAEAPITSDESVQTIMSVLAKLNVSHAGLLLTNEGIVLPF